MNAVLYTKQMEPITVVDIPMWLWERLAKGDHIRLAVTEPLISVPSDMWPTYGPPKVVEIFGERIRRYEHETLMLFTADEENALLLRAEFLPGQRGELRNRERGAFAKGFLDALTRLSPEN